jgi:hypothetical protein
MNQEEYEQCKIDQYSDDPLKALQARFILTMFPTEGTKFVAKTPKCFWKCTTPEIVDIWMRVNGETYKTKREWLSIDRSSGI